MAAAKSLADQLKPLSSEAQEERLMSFLASCDCPTGTPAYNVMANQLGILEEGVRVILGRLENKGRIHFISRNPPRIMLMTPGEQPLGPDVPGQHGDAYGRLLSAQGERMRLGRFIADCERQGRPMPSLREMHEFVGFGSVGYINRMAEMLCESGLLQYGRGVPTRLTELGRNFFGVKTKEGAKKMETAKVVVIPTSQTPHARQSMKAKVKALCAVLAERCRADPEKGSYTKYRELAKAMGYAEHSSGLVSDVAREAIRLGYLKEKPFKCHGLFFTEKGRAKFMPETIEEGMPGKPEPEITFTDRVAPDSPLREAAAEVFAEPVVAQVARTIPQHRADALDFDLTSKRLRVTGSTNSRAELAAFIGKLGSLMPFLGE